MSKRYLVEQVWTYSFASHSAEIAQVDDLAEAKKIAESTPRRNGIENQRVEVVDNQTNAVLYKVIHNREV